MPNDSITQGSLAASSNYALSYVGADLSVLARPLTLTYAATPANGIYGDTPAGLTGTTSVIGLVNGDTLSGTASGTTTATSGSGVGRYEVTGAGLSASSNYVLTSLQANGNRSALTVLIPASPSEATIASVTFGNHDNIGDMRLYYLKFKASEPLRFCDEQNRCRAFAQ